MKLVNNKVHCNIHYKVSESIRKQVRYIVQQQIHDLFSSQRNKNGEVLEHLFWQVSDEISGNLRWN